jgi:hypothetical protein
VNGEVADSVAPGADLASSTLPDDRRLSYGELSFAFVRVQSRRPGEDHHQNVALVVDVLRRPFSGPPMEERGVQIRGLGSPDRTVALPRRAGRENAQRLLGHQLFDQREEAPFLESHVACEERRQLAHDPAKCAAFRPIRDEFSELCCGGVEALMLEQGLDNQFACLFRVGDAWKQEFLLFAKVWHCGASEEGQEGGRSCGRARAARAIAEAPRRDERGMMVMREGDESWMPFHPLERTCARFADDPTGVRARRREPRIQR